MDKEIFTAYVRPRIYITSLVISVDKKDLVEKVQWVATKIVPEIKESSYKERTAAMILPKLKRRRRRADIITSFKF